MAHSDSSLRPDPFGAQTTLELSEGPTEVFRLDVLQQQGIADLDRLPFSIRILLENALRHAGRGYVTEADVRAIAAWSPTHSGANIPFMPSRVVLQDFTGVPAVVDLAAMRSGLAAMGGEAERINPVVPADMVIDHSVQVDFFGTTDAYQKNVELEMERNRERYELLRWGQEAFRNFRVVPPGTGIVHQVNLEYLASVVHRRSEFGADMAFPDTVVGTDSHTTMINGLGVVGWGVGGIEAEAVLLGQPYYMLLPEVVGVKLRGSLPEGATATDLVLRVTELLRKHGVVGRFVEFYGKGLSSLSLADRATIANMAPEYGATIGFFPVDDETLRYLRGTGRPEALVERVEKVSRALHLFRSDDTPDPEFTSVLDLDLSTIVPSLAGPRRPQDRVELSQVGASFTKEIPGLLPQGVTLSESTDRVVHLDVNGIPARLTDGSIVIAAITSCTNTSNPSVMVGAGLLARNAVQRGLSVQPWIKTSLAPGSKVVTDYLTQAGLLPYLEALRFAVVGYGCTTCIGNSGPLDDTISDAIRDNGLVVASVLSGNRNFEARIHPLVRANYLASPMLVVAFALAGRIDLDLTKEPLGHSPDGSPVYLSDLWPSQEEIRDTIQTALKPQMYADRYAEVFEGDALWQALPLPEGNVSLYAWNPDSTYIRNPPFFEGMSLASPPNATSVDGARILAILGDSVTTDHISPAGAIPKGEPAALWLQEREVQPWDFNTFGSRRGNHEVMMRGTFGNVRIRNQMLDGREGGYTRHEPSGEVLSIYDASMRYQEDAVPLVILAGAEYGSGSSRDWAAKGTALLGVKAVIAQSYERIHRSNLVGMGVLPLEFPEGVTPVTLGFEGSEVLHLEGLGDGLRPGGSVRVRAVKADGTEVRFHAPVRLDSDVDLEYFRNGGILHTVLRKMARGEM